MIDIQGRLGKIVAGGRRLANTAEMSEHARIRDAQPDSSWRGFGLH